MLSAISWYSGPSLIRLLRLSELVLLRCFAESAFYLSVHTNVCVSIICTFQLSEYTKDPMSLISEGPLYLHPYKALGVCHSSASHF